MEFWLAQALGAIGFVIVVIAFASKTRKRLVFFLLLASVLFTPHYALLGKWTGFAIGCVAFCRNLLFYRWDRPPIRWTAFFSLSFIVAGLGSWEGLVSILPMSAMVLETVAIGIPTGREPLIRKLNFWVHPQWFVYNAFGPSIGGVILEAFLMSWIRRSIKWYDKDGQTEEMTIQGVWKEWTRKLPWSPDSRR